MPGPVGQAGFVLPKPGKALKAILLTVFGVWLAFAIGINWGGVSPDLFMALCGNDAAILQGQLWRFFTAPLMHMPSQTIGHILTTLLGLYFLSPSLEESWGAKRFVRFVVLTAVLSFVVQFLVQWALPASLSAKLVPDYWFGALPVVEAIAIAWAMSFKGRTVQLFFILPVSSRGLILFVVAMSLMYLIVGAQAPAGHIAPFAGMGLGWLLGGGSPSPLRRFYLKVRLRQLEIEAQRDAVERKKRVKTSGLRVLEGGQGDKKRAGKDDDDGPDGKLLN
jgi:membrane associated rhomboid family serine protease